MELSMEATIWGCKDVNCSWLDATLKTVCVCVWVKYTLLLSANVMLSVWLTTLSMVQFCSGSVLREPSNSDGSFQSFYSQNAKASESSEGF